MSLVLQPKLDGSPDEHRVIHGAFQVGSMKKMTFRTDEKWFWSLSSVLFGPTEVRISGVAATLEEAKIAIKENWELWLKWAELSEIQAPSGGTRGPEVLSVTISKVG
jgi:hypothetical protein